MEEATIMFHTRAQEQNFKKYATSLQNTSNFEESTFQEIVAEELARLKKTMISLQCHPCWSNHGIQKTSQSVCTCFGLPASRGVDFKGSQTCEWQMHFGDLALLVSSKDAPEVVEVWCFAKASNQGRIFALVQCLDLETCSVATRSGTWRLTSNTSFLPVENILGPLTYCQLQPGQVRCLLPWHFCQ